MKRNKKNSIFGIVVPHETIF